MSRFQPTFTVQPEDGVKIEDWYNKHYKSCDYTGPGLRYIFSESGHLSEVRCMCGYTWSSAGSIYMVTSQYVVQPREDAS